MAHNGAWLWHANIRLEVIPRGHKCSACGQETRFKLFLPGMEFVQYCCLLPTSCAQRSGNKLARRALKEGRETGICLQGSQAELTRQYVLQELLPQALLPLEVIYLNGSASSQERCSSCSSPEPKYQVQVSVLGTYIVSRVCGACRKQEKRSVARQARVFIARELVYPWNKGTTIVRALELRH